MKAIIYAAYVLVVLMFSAFAKADVTLPLSQILVADGPQANVKVTDIAYDSSNLEVQVSGFLPNPCYRVPVAQVVVDSNDPQVLQVQMTSPVPTSICPASILGYQTTVSLPTLVQSSGIPLQSSEMYRVRFGDYTMEMNVTGEELLKVPGFVLF